MAESVLICPFSQQPCSYADYCNERKQVMELQALPELEGVPQELVDANNGSYCSTERLESIGETAMSMTTPCGKASPDYGDRILRWSSDLTASILNARRSKRL